MLRSVNAIGRLSSVDLRPWLGHEASTRFRHGTSRLGYPSWRPLCQDVRWSSAIFRAWREIWGDAALYVPPSDHEALSLCVNSLIAKRAVRDELGRRARKRGLSLTAERMTQVTSRRLHAGSRTVWRNKGVGSSCVS